MDRDYKDLIYRGANPNGQQMYEKTLNFNSAQKNAH